MLQSINALTLRQKFGEVIDRVVRTGQPIIIERQNKPLVVLYPYAEKKEEIERKAQDTHNASTMTRLFSLRKQWGKGKKQEDSTVLIRRMRDERYGKYHE